MSIVYVLNGTVETGGQECQPGTFWFTLLTQRMVLTAITNAELTVRLGTHGCLSHADTLPYPYFCKLSPRMDCLVRKETILS